MLPKNRPPVHPGEILLEEFLKPLGLSQGIKYRLFDFRNGCKALPQRQNKRCPHKCYPFKHRTTLLTWRCHPDTVALWEELEKKSFEDRARHISRDFSVAQFEFKTAKASIIPSVEYKRGDLPLITDALRSMNLNRLSVTIEPISTKSRIDERVVISKFRWTVTLITHGGSTGDHALLVTEGINDGYVTDLKENDYFMIRSDYNSQYELNSSLILPEDLKFETRSQVWIATRKKVKQMLDSIQADKAHPPKLNILGKNALVQYKGRLLGPPRLVRNPEGTESCITWAREKLKIVDVVLKRRLTQKFYLATTTYTQPHEYYKDIPVEESLL